jgi:hypothetical protein
MEENFYIAEYLPASAESPSAVVYYNQVSGLPTINCGAITIIFAEGVFIGWDVRGTQWMNMRNATLPSQIRFP